MKTRTTTNSSSFQSNSTSEWFNGNQTVNGSGSWSHLSWQDYVTHGDSIPNWKAQIANGYDATTYLEGSRRSRTYSPGFSYKKGFNDLNQSVYEFQTQGPLLNALPAIPSSPSGLSTDEANRLALTKFNARVLEVNQTFNGGVFLGELGQTLRGIKRPAESLFRSVGAYRREAKKLRQTIVRSRDHLNELSSSNRRQLISSANQAIAGLYLEKKFHWDPLINDIDDGVKTLASLSASHEMWKIVSSTGRDTSTSSAYEGSWSLGGSGAGDVWHNFKSEVSVRYKGGVGIQPKDSNVPVLESLGLGLRNFVPTIWELVPYSFVADYFTNIGDVLNGWSSGGYNVRWCCKTVRMSNSVAWEYRNSRYDSSATFHWLVQDFIAPSVVADWTIVQRVHFPGPYTPSLTWRIPGLSTKWLNLGALASARFLDRFL